MDRNYACGTPVLRTPMGGMPEVLANFSPELIADSAEVEAIATRLEALLSGKISIELENEIDLGQLYRSKEARKRRQEHESCRPTMLVIGEVLLTTIIKLDNL